MSKPFDTHERGRSPAHVPQVRLMLTGVLIPLPWIGNALVLNLYPDAAPRGLIRATGPFSFFATLPIFLVWATVFANREERGIPKCLVHFFSIVMLCSLVCEQIYYYQHEANHSAVRRTKEVSMKPAEANDNSFLRENQDWLRPLISSVMIITSPIVANSLLAGSGIQIPHWLTAITVPMGGLGAIIGYFRARMTGTLTAQIAAGLTTALIEVYAFVELIEWLATVFKH